MARHRKGIKQRQPGTAAHPLMRWDQTSPSEVFGAGSAGDDFSTVIFDNSVLAGGKYVKIGKLTLQWFIAFDDLNTRLYMAVYKQKEGSTAESLDDEVAIRDMRSEGRLIRGPWWMSSYTPGSFAAGQMMPRKTIVLEDLLLDPNDDLLVGWTLVDTMTGTNNAFMYMRAFWRVTE